VRDIGEHFGGLIIGNRAMNWGIAARQNWQTGKDRASLDSME
jgi:hypothetical protein